MNEYCQEIQGCTTMRESAADMECQPSMQDAEYWPTVIQAIKDHTGWTASELADRAGIDRATISRLTNKHGHAPVFLSGMKLEILYQAVCLDIQLGEFPL